MMKKQSDISPPTQPNSLWSEFSPDREFRTEDAASHLLAKVVAMMREHLEFRHFPIPGAGIDLFPFPLHFLFW